MSIRSASPALAAAILFGVATPVAKLLVGDLPPLLLAGLLYLGSGIGLGLILLVRIIRAPSVVALMRIPGAEWPWLLGAIAAGGMVGPVLLMWGLQSTDGATASLLLNLEAVLTAAIAWVVFKENADRQVVLGMISIVAGGVLLSWAPGGATVSAGALLIVGACVAWAIDNNLTRRVSDHDAMLVACLKGLIAGGANTGIAFATSASGAVMPAAGPTFVSLLVGFLGYGLSLTLFVLGLRTLGAARTGAYFSVAPLFGVMVSLAIWPQVPDPVFWFAAVLMGLGVWMHVRERHSHRHTHEPLIHTHRHRHDAHHAHTHEFPWDGTEPHVHRHRHEAMTHVHPHYPDIHHRHPH